MNITTKLLVILVASTLWPTTSPAAEFFRELYGHFGYLTLTGRIVEGDFDRFKQIAPRSTADGIQIILDSTGGDISAYLRDLGMSPATIVYLTSAPPSSVNWLTSAKANELGLKITVLEKGMDPLPVPPRPPRL